MYSRKSIGSRMLSTGRFLIASLLIVALLVWQDNGAKLLEVFSNFQLHYLGILLILQVLLNGVSSAKWHLFLKDREIDVSLGSLFKLYLIGRFFNNFLPSMVGGDVARSYMLGKKIKSQATSAASVTLERATGMIALTFLAVFFAAINPNAFTNPIVIATVFASSAVCVGAIFVFSSLKVSSFLQTSLAPSESKLLRKVLRLINEIEQYRGRSKVLWWAFAQSCVFQILAGLNVYIACLSIGLHADLLDVLVVTPAILILAMIPVSPNNIGWWEWCFSVLLVGAGATAAQGFAVALTLRAVSMVSSLVGGILFLFEKQSD